MAGIDAYCENVKATVVEGTINERLEDIAERILIQNPQVIGFCCYIWNITATKQAFFVTFHVIPSANYLKRLL
jgi:hypothetical protein